MKLIAGGRDAPSRGCQTPPATKECGELRRGQRTMTLIMYERVGVDERRPSPFSWRIRYALAHKGIEPEFRHVRFADVETIRALSGQHFVPIVTDGDRVIHDSWNIACYLEDCFPDA